MLLSIVLLHFKTCAQVSGFKIKSFYFVIPALINKGNDFTDLEYFEKQVKIIIMVFLQKG